MPETKRLRRQQLALGILVLVLGGFTVVGDQGRKNADDDQRSCLVENFAALNANLSLRTEFTARDTLLKKRTLAASGYESAASDRIWQTFGEAAGYLRDDPAQEIPPEEAARLNAQLVEDLLHYLKVSERVNERRMRLAKKTEALEAKRAENPVPPFPSGTCEEE